MAALQQPHSAAAARAYLQAGITPCIKPPRWPPLPARPHCPPAGAGRWVYTLKLLVEDATAQLDVILFGPDGDAFFSGLAARDMGADPRAAADLLHQLHRLLGAGCQR